MVTVAASRGNPRDNSVPSPLQSRIEECQELRDLAITQDEKDGWLAEEVGLLDALLGVDRTAIQHQGPPCQFERYVLGLLDGQTILKVFADGTVRSESDGRTSHAPMHCTRPLRDVLQISSSAR